MVSKGAPKTGVDVFQGGRGKSKDQKNMDDFVYDLEQRAPKMDAKAKKKVWKQMQKDPRAMTLKPKAKKAEEKLNANVTVPRGKREKKAPAKLKE